MSSRRGTGVHSTTHSEACASLADETGCCAGGSDHFQKACGSRKGSEFSGVTTI